MTHHSEPAPAGAHHVEYRDHVGQSRQYIRDIVLGVNDGLVSTFLLVVGVVGGGLATDQVLLTAIAGAIAGSVSMAAGEYLATQSQEEVFDREIDLEREHIEHFREAEVDQLRGFLGDLGVRDQDLEGATTALSHDDATLLESMKVFEFAIVDSERRSAFLAMAMSGLLFLVGAAPPTIPFFFGPTPGVGLMWAIGLTSIGLFAVGLAKTRVTDGSPLKSGLQNLVIAGVGGVIAYLVGSLVDGIVG